MDSRIESIISKLVENHDVTDEELLLLLDISESNDAEEVIEKLSKEADAVRRKYYGNKVFVRGLIEISNICKNNCLYCGIRRDNKNVDRYSLDKDAILECCKKGYEIGFRTFVMQGGENGCYDAESLSDIIKEIKKECPGVAVTLSIGELSFDEYKSLKEAGADRYLLRHEAINKSLYQMIHPKEMDLDNRIECLNNLKELGFQTGSGFMVGVPYQTNENLIEDIRFLQKLKPQMIGIGPFIPHKDTPFKDFESGTINKTLVLLSILRLMHPNVLLPSTTSLGTLSPEGRIRGIKAGANVIMPNLSPSSIRDKYMLYNNKARTGVESAEGLKDLIDLMDSHGYEIVIDRGDFNGDLH